METGFLNKHDSEYFSDVNYDQTNGFECESSFFSGLINECNDFDDFQWGVPDGGNLNDSTLNIIASDTPAHQDHFSRSLNEWQQHISNLKLKEEEDDLFADSKIPDIFPSLASPRHLASPLQPLLDDSLDPDDLIEVLAEPTTPENSQSSEFIPSTEGKSGTDSAVSAPKSLYVKQEPVDISELLDFNLPQNDYDRSQAGESSSDLGPDNYDVVDIKVEGDDENDEVDVETIPDAVPVIEANDIASLLNQFEATEKFNKISKNKMKDLDGPKVPPLIIKKTKSLLKVEPAPSPKASPLSEASPSGPFPVPKNAPVNRTIIDSLPKEIIERIKKSSEKKKKVVPVVPAEPLPARGSGYAKDGGAKSKSREMVSTATVQATKLHKKINKKMVRNDSAQIDHDYCTNDSKNSKQLPKVDPVSRKKPLPTNKPPVTVVVDAFSVTEEDKWVLDNEQKLTALPTASPSPSEASSNARNSWEKNSKRDSGLESGDVSDASESPSDKKIPLNVQTLRIKSAPEIKIENEDCPPTPEASPQIHSEVPNAIDGANEAKKKKLNLDEYRTRRKFARLSSPVKTGTIGEAILSNKWVQRPKEEKDVTVQENASVVEKAETNVRVPPSEMRVDASPKKIENEKRRRNSRSHERPKSRYRHRSSSSSSSGSRVRSSRHHGRSRDKRRAPRRSRSRNRQWSRSRSRSNSSFSSSSSSRSRSRSVSRSRCSRSSRYRRSRSRSRSSYRKTSIRRYSQSSSSSRFSSDRLPRRPDDWNSGERQKQVEERRVIYVGQIEEGTTKSQLRERFQLFGPIVDISLHFRERGDNYGFVTFGYKGDAYKAVEHGNDNPLDTRYEICFGGRRAFCKQRYADLDSMAPQTTYSPYHQSRTNESFDSLLRAAQEKLLRGQKPV